MWMYSDVVRADFHVMLDWFIGMNNSFSISAGKKGKLYKDLLPAIMYEKYAQTYSDSDYNHLWSAIFTMCDMFHMFAISVGEHFGYIYNQSEEDGMRIYLEMVKNEGTP